MHLAVAIAGLAFLVLIHEAGHFFVALAVRMRPRRFYIFFPPALVKTVRNGIEYGIGSIPLGGYVKIPGMHRPAPGDVETYLGRALEEAPWLGGEAEALKRALADDRLDNARKALDELRRSLGRAELSDPARRSADRGLRELDDGLSDDAYWRSAVWKRIAVIFAGPGVNLLFAVVALAATFVIGVPTVSRSVGSITPNSGATAAGLRPGDTIVAVNGQPTTSFDAISTRIQASHGKPIRVTVVRDGHRIVLRPSRPHFERDQGRFILGFVPAFVDRSYGPADSFRRAAVQTGHVTVAIGESLGRIFTGSGRKEVSSVIGITQASSQAVAYGFTVYLQILALISLSLALLNLLPLLPLDGGHIAMSLLEKIRRRPLPREAYERFSAVGIALVLMLFFIGLSNDISRIRGS